MTLLVRRTYRIPTQMCQINSGRISRGRIQKTILSMHTAKLHMQFVTSVLYEITCITSKTYRLPTQMSVPASSMGWRMLIVQIFRAKKKTTDPQSSRGAAARAFLYITERSFSTGRIYYTMHPPAHTKLHRRYPREDPCWSHLDASRVSGFGEGNSSVIEGFETRFGDGSNVCEVDCEGTSRQPHGYTKVSQ